MLILLGLPIEAVIAQTLRPSIPTMLPVFSVFDRAFGIYRVPGPCTAPLGVTDRMSPTLAGQLGYAFSPRAYRRLFRKRSKPAE